MLFRKGEESRKAKAWLHRVFAVLEAGEKKKFTVSGITVTLGSWKLKSQTDRK